MLRAGSDTVRSCTLPAPRAGQRKRLDQPHSGHGFVVVRSEDAARFFVESSSAGDITCAAQCSRGGARPLRVRRSTRSRAHIDRLVEEGFQLARGSWRGVDVGTGTVLWRSKDDIQVRAGQASAFETLSRALRAPRSVAVRDSAD